MTDLALMSAIELVERGLAPDVGIRLGIRRLLSKRLADERRGGPDAISERFRRLVADLSESPIALATDEANRQHYEVPPPFFERVLGPNLKYSSALFEPGTESLADAEAAMLDLSLERAGVRDGMTVLDLGCGWGSLSLWLARRFPRCRVLAVSNSSSQREHIERRAAVAGVGDRVEVLTADVNALTLERRFDRVLSVEMFEHVRNYRRLLERIRGWLEPDGRLFVHIFCHRDLAYPFEVDGADNWMGRHFFTGGLMPSADLLLFFQQHLQLEQRWLLSGEHYAKTARAWLENLDRNRASVRQVFADVYGEREADRWIERWRIFFMACEELWGYERGAQWMVAHYDFRPR